MRRFFQRDLLEKQIPTVCGPAMCNNQALPASARQNRFIPLLFLVPVAVAAAFLAGWAPLSLSIAAVFLFAGPHNWAEARYMLGRLPARPGKLWPWFLTSACGVIGLTVSLALLPFAERSGLLGESGFETGVTIWNTVLIAWVTTLALWRARQNPRRDWDWLLPAALALAALNWAFPYLFSFGLVYLHPVMALVLLDRELGKSRPNWRPAYRAALASIPVCLGILWFRLADAPPLPGDTELFQTIQRHAGSELFEGVSSHFLVSAHAFLELVHYAVWLVAIPAVGWRSLPWKLNTIPAACRSANWRRLVATFLVCGALAVVLLWAAFLADYTVTRHVYFTIAMVHVLAEVPFLLRAL